MEPIDEIPPVCPIDLPEENTGIVYLVQEAIHAGKCDWYKIGRTTDLYGRYGKDTIVISAKTVRNPGYVETELKKAFGCIFRLVKGTETFEGDPRLMYWIFETQTTKYIHLNRHLIPIPEIRNQRKSGVEQITTSARKIVKHQVIKNSKEITEQEEIRAEKSEDINNSNQVVATIKEVTTTPIAVSVIKSEELTIDPREKKSREYDEKYAKADLQKMSEIIFNEASVLYEERIRYRFVCPKCGESWNFIYRHKLRVHMESKGDCLSKSKHHPDWREIQMRDATVIDYLDETEGLIKMNVPGAKYQCKSCLETFSSRCVAETHLLRVKGCPNLRI